MKIAIIGGGPAGLFTAIALKQLNHDVFVLEAGTYSKQRAGEHLSASALTFIKNLNIPDHLVDNNSIRCIGVEGAWGQEELLSRSSIFNPYGDGIILSRPAFDSALATYCTSQNIAMETDCRVSALIRNEEGWEIIAKNQKFEAHFVVDASGRNSKFSKILGADKIAYDDLIGIAQVMKPTQIRPKTESQLLIETIPDGWWYSVQLPSGDVVATFMTNATVFTGSGENQAVFWKNRFKESKHTSKKWAQYKPNDKPFTQSAKTQILQKTVGDNWLAVGDAAMSYDPLSSAGILKGIRMGISAAGKIDAWANGNTNALDEYDKKCKDDFDEYLLQKETYYALEKRFNNNPFWYSRNIRPKSLNNFRILPHQSLEVKNGQHIDKLNYLSSQLPEVNFQSMLECIDNHGSAQLVLKEYLRNNKEVALGKHHFQAIESLEQIGMIVVI